jgi:hypothetical protein
LVRTQKNYFVEPKDNLYIPESYVGSLTIEVEFEWGGRGGKVVWKIWASLEIVVASVLHQLCFYSREGYFLYFQVEGNNWQEINLLNPLILSDCGYLHNQVLFTNFAMQSELSSKILSAVSSSLPLTV